MMYPFILMNHRMMNTKLSTAREQENKHTCDEQCTPLTGNHEPEHASSIGVKKSKPEQYDVDQENWVPVGETWLALGQIFEHGQQHEKARNHNS